MSTYLIISDTHDNLSNLEVLKKHVNTYLRNVDTIIHLGDITSPFTLKELLNLGIELVVILGNNDGDKLLLKEVYGKISEPPLEIRLCGLDTLLIHGFKSASITHKIVNALARGGDYDIILFGHTHRYYLDVVGSTLVMNPGALSGYLTQQPTYGVVDFKEGKAYIASLINGRHLLSTSLPSRT